VVAVRLAIFSSNFKFYAAYFESKSSVGSNKSSKGSILRDKWLKKIKRVKWYWKKIAEQVVTRPNLYKIITIVTILLLIVARPCPQGELVPKGLLLLC